MDNGSKRIVRILLLGLIPLLLLAVPLLIRRASLNRVNATPSRLVYSIYCANNRYIISGRTQDEAYSSYGEKLCKVSETVGQAGPENTNHSGARSAAAPASSLSDPLTAAEEEVNDLGGVGAFCSCDHKLYVYCINRRIKVSELSPAEMHLQPDGNSCEQAEAGPTKGREEPSKEREDTTSCTCPKLAADAKTGEAQGGGWPLLGFILPASLVALLLFLRLKQRPERPGGLLDPGGQS